MEIFKTDIEDVLILKPKVFNDTRGYFFESYSKKEFDRTVAPIDFVQDNESMSTYGVVRGLHFQNPPYAQSKLVRCVRGKVLDVALDIRKALQLTADMWQLNYLKKTTFSYSYQKDLPMDLLSFLPSPYSSTSVTVFTIQMPIMESAFLTTH